MSSYIHNIKLIVLLFVFIGITGCAGAIRSDNVRLLVEKEKTGLVRVNQLLKDLEDKIGIAVKNLKKSHQLYVNNLIIWEKELKRAQIFAASPGDLRNLPVRKAVFTQFAQLEIDRYDAYVNLQRQFDIQANALNESYKKILNASKKLQEQIEVIDTYVHESGFKFAIESIDLKTVKEALSEFEQGKILLQKAAKAGEALNKSIGYVKIADRNEQMRELTEVLSLISSKLQELEHE